MATMGQRIKELRKEYEFTQEELGSKLGVSKPAISMYENDKMSAEDHIKLKLCKIFDVSLDYLMGLSNSRHSDKVALIYDYPEQKEVLEAVLARNPRLAELCKIVDNMNDEQYEDFKRVVRLIQK